MDTRLQPPADRCSSRSPTPDQPAAYQIVVQGKLDANWAEWLGGMTMAEEANGASGVQTILDGVVRDQAALRGLLCKLWDLNLTLISVSRTSTEAAQAAGGEQ